MTLLHQAAQKAVEALIDILGVEVMAPEGGREEVQEIHCMARAALASLESALQHQEVPREPVAVARPLTSEEEENAWNSITEQGCSCCTAAVRLFCRLNGITLSDAVLAASPSTTRQQEVGSTAAVHLTADEISSLMMDLSDHDGKDFEAECPSCTAFRKLASACVAASPSTPENADGGPHG